MPKLISDFPQVPEDDDPNRVALYAAIYGQLEDMGINLPGPGPGQISHDSLVKHLQQEAGKIVKQELQAAKYTGHTDEECAALLDVAEIPGAFNAPPIHDILIAFPFVPNTVTGEDVAGAKTNGNQANKEAKG